MGIIQIVVSAILITEPERILSCVLYTLMFLFHNGVNTYMIRIVRDVGGDSGSMGLTLGIAAAAELPVLFLYGKIIKTGKIRDTTLIIVSGTLFVLRGIRSYGSSRNDLCIHRGSGSRNSHHNTGFSTKVMLLLSR